MICCVEATVSHVAVGQQTNEHVALRSGVRLGRWSQLATQRRDWWVLGIAAVIQNHSVATFLCVKLGEVNLYNLHKILSVYC